MKKDFLTIPDAPNYEINSDLIVRNKRNGHIKAVKHSRTSAKSYVSLYHNGKTIFRSRESFRQSALAAVQKVTWEIIPDFDGLYEINVRGIVRNARTKRLLKKRKRVGNAYVLFKKGKRISCSVKSLLWQVYGILPPKGESLPAGVRIIKIDAPNVRYTFDTKKAAADFLSRKLFYSAKYITKLMSERISEFKGWQLLYLDSDLYSSKFATMA